MINITQILKELLSYSNMFSIRRSTITGVNIVYLLDIILLNIIIFSILCFTYYNVVQIGCELYYIVKGDYKPTIGINSILIN